MIKNMDMDMKIGNKILGLSTLPMEIPARCAYINPGFRLFFLSFLRLDVSVHLPQLAEDT